MKTYITNCILTFKRGPQAVLDLRVPLDAGEEVCRVFFGGIAEVLRPTLPITLRGEGYTPPVRAVLTIDEAKDNGLLIVSMAVTNGVPGAMDNAETYLPAWFHERKGRLSFT